MNLQDVIAAAGLTAYGRNSYGPCPVCGADRRGRHDRRGAIAVYDGGDQWKCLASGCGVGGSGLALAAAVRFGQIPGHGDPRWRELYDGDGKRREVRPEQKDPVYPPQEEVAALWGACLPPQDAAGDVRVAWWLHDRALPETPLVRSMPPGTVAFEWVPEAAWSTHPIVVPMVDAAGVVRSLRWRAARSIDHPKSLPATGFDTRALVMADDVGRAVLAGRYDGWNGKVVVCEGEPDWLSWATRGGGWATFGLVAGSWTAALAARIPDGTQVALRLHDDAAGHKYADVVRRSLAGRCRVTERPASPTREQFETVLVGQMMAAFDKYGSAHG